MLRRLAALPRRQRAVMVLRCYEHMPDDEIAEILGISASTVRVHAARALSTLRQAVIATRTGSGTRG